jgi:cholera toxin transcriptional activator
MASRGEPDRRPTGVIRFGPFELHPEAGELRKQGIRIKLQPKPFHILCILLENPGATVSRDDICKRLWTEDTFVDFERGVNSAVNRLRLALGDSAEQPRYIETLSRTGYRFIAPVMPLASMAEPKEIVMPRPRRYLLNLGLWPDRRSERTACHRGPG